MPLITIRNRFTQATLFECEAESIKEAVEKANLSGANLSGASLDGASLDGANLSRASLDGASLYGASLYGASLDGASLSRANLSRASLSRASLDGANLSRANLDGASLYGASLSRASLDGASLDGASLYGASLDGANLSRANLYGASLDGARINWTSHSLVSEILRVAAGQDIEKLKVAGLILLQQSSGWCWGQFLAIEDPLKEWALDTLAPWVQDGDEAPKILRDRAASLKAAAEPPTVTAS